ncbi:MAG: zinc ribbon domain-containing protein [Promethearchaeota archaeon]|nr:MAG: zinc ribbon domain-containing protein [Candidatus Lokiarchaeota archaeon]
MNLDQNINKNHLIIIKTVYTALLILFFISLTQTYFYDKYTFIDRTIYQSVSGYEFLSIFGWLGMIIIIIAIIFLYKNKLRKAILIGLIGCATLGYDFIYASYIYIAIFKYRIEAWYYLGLFSWIGLISINILSYTITRKHISKPMIPQDLSKEGAFSLIGGAIALISLLFPALYLDVGSQTFGNRIVSIWMCGWSHDGFLFTGFITLIFLGIFGIPCTIVVIYASTRSMSIYEKIKSPSEYKAFLIEKWKKYVGYLIGVPIIWLLLLIWINISFFAGHFAALGFGFFGPILGGVISGIGLAIYKPDTSVPVSLNAHSQVTKNFCTNCGSPIISKNDEYCRKCGFKLN